MLGTLKVPNEFRYIQALALAVDQRDCLGFLLSIRALQDEDLEAVERVRERVRGQLDLSQLPGWLRGGTDYCRVVLASALRGSEARGYVAYRLAEAGLSTGPSTGSGRSSGQGERALVDALARVGVATEFYSRPWEDGLSGSRVECWRGWVREILVDW